MRFLISTLVAICAATSANACGFMGQPPCAPVAPIQPHFPTANLAPSPLGAFFFTGRAGKKTGLTSQ
jgi:hypothetical protein